MGWIEPIRLLCIHQSNACDANISTVIISKDQYAILDPVFIKPCQLMWRNASFYS